MFKKVPISKKKKILVRNFGLRAGGKSCWFHPFTFYCTSWFIFLAHCGHRENETETMKCSMAWLPYVILQWQFLLLYLLPFWKWTSTFANLVFCWKLSFLAFNAPYDFFLETNSFFLLVTSGSSEELRPSMSWILSKIDHILRIENNHSNLIHIF